jgi:hypothetical protein
MASKFVPKKILSVGEQFARIRGLYPHFYCRATKNGLLIAEGDIRPTARSVAYRVRIEYRTYQPPDVYVLSPKLKPREEGGRLPHVYPGNRLCLYLPGVGEWTSEMSLAHTLVPWISEWLFFYETWRALGVWLGGGVEPREHTPIRRDDQENANGRDQ